MTEPTGTTQVGEGSHGTRVPSACPVKLEVGSEDPMSGAEHGVSTKVPVTKVDRDFLCPICMQTIKDAFLTTCGHSFCYSCVTTHLKNKNNCPCCFRYLTHEQLFPNFLLNKLLKKAAGGVLFNTASPTELLRQALQQGTQVSVKELDLLLQLLAEKKKKVEHEEAEVNMEILLDFLERTRHQKEEELRELQSDLGLLAEDIGLVKGTRAELLREKESFAAGTQGIDTEVVAITLPPRGGGGGGEEASQGRLEGASGSGLVAGDEAEGAASGRGRAAEEAGPSMESPPRDKRAASSSPVGFGQNVSKKRRVFQQFDDLQECYFERRRRKYPGGAGLEAHPGLSEFQSVLGAYTRYSRLRVVAELGHGDLFHSSNIVSSIEFDRDDELFATAGVSRRIKVFDFASVVNEVADVHCPVVEMSTRSKLSCLSWNAAIKGHMASSDYEGIVTLWDVGTHQSIMEYEEHEKRAWSVDFSKTDPTLLVSGSDDGKVKVWCTNQEASVLNIDMKANICCVKYNPGSSNFIAVGSADHHIHYYDLRNTHAPLHSFSGHRKAVSYVKFISSTELASASTDSSLRLWNVQENRLCRTMRGHTNEKNFVGLTVNSDYLACGSETNEVYVFCKAMSKPAAVHRFGGSDPLTGEESDDDGSHFISAVCWKSDSTTMLAANSQGTIKVLSLAP